MRPIVTDRVAWSVCHTSEPCKNGWTDRDAIWIGDSTWLREPCIRSGLDPHGQGQLWGGKGRPIVKYRDTLQSSVQKRLNRSRCCLGSWLTWAQGGNHILHGVLTSHGKGQFLGKAALIVKYSYFLLWAVQNGCTGQFSIWVVDSGGPKEAQFNRICQVAPMYRHGRAHWRHLANMIERLRRRCSLVSDYFGYLLYTCWNSCCTLV